MEFNKKNFKKKQTKNLLYGFSMIAIGIVSLILSVTFINTLPDTPPADDGSSSSSSYEDSGFSSSSSYEDSDSSSSSEEEIDEYMVEDSTAWDQLFQIENCTISITRQIGNDESLIKAYIVKDEIHISLNENEDVYFQKQENGDWVQIYNDGQDFIGEVLSEPINIFNLIEMGDYTGRYNDFEYFDHTYYCYDTANKITLIQKNNQLSEVTLSASSNNVSYLFEDFDETIVVVPEYIIPSDVSPFPDAISVECNETYTVSIETSGESKYYKFTPLSDEYLYIVSSGYCDTRVYLYDSEGNELEFNDDNGSDLNFFLEYYFESGETYYIEVSLYEDATGTFTFMIW